MKPRPHEINNTRQFLAATTTQPQPFRSCLFSLFLLALLIVVFCIG